jgi:hypothetical protein
LKFCQLGFYGVERFDRIRPRRLVDRDGRSGHAIEPRLPIHIRSAKFDSRHISESEDRAILVGSNHDLFEFRNGREPAFGLDIELKPLIL